MRTTGIFTLISVVWGCCFVASEGASMTSKTKPMTSERGIPTPCVKLGPCSCRSADGIIDLSPLADNITAKYKDVPDTQGADMYSWNPCVSFTETPHCVNVAPPQAPELCIPFKYFVKACQKTIGLNESKNIGTQETAQFVVIETGDLTLQYTHPDPSGVNRTTIVTLTCDPNAHDMIGVVGEMVAFQYSITLTSKFACPRKE